MNERLKQKFGVVLQLLSTVTKHRTHNNHRHFTSCVKQLNGHIPVLKKCIETEIGQNTDNHKSIIPHLEKMTENTTKLVIKADNASGILKEIVPNDIIYELRNAITTVQTMFSNPAKS